MQYATENIIPVTLELGGKSPNIFFNSVMDADDEFLDKAIEGAVLFALNQGEICTCPSRLLVQEDIADAFIAKVIERVKAIKVGNPLDKTVMMGAQASQIQKDKILSYIKLGKEEGAEVLVGGDVNHVEKVWKTVIISANHFQRKQQNENLPGRDFRTCVGVHDFQR
jgi:aldehyde dehydrogenase